MGRRFPGVRARQHSDLTAPTAPGPDRLRLLVLGVLALDGVLSALMAVFFLPLRIGGVPLPISAVLSGALNVGLVWVALQWTTSPRLAALPLWTWLATVLLCTFGGPGDDIVFGGSGLMEYASVLLIAVGALPAGWLLSRRRAAAPSTGAGARTRAR
ncbi:hypothetical protein BST22_05120 [Mycolicibacterium chubuense]|uniref:hypothetical protein n=1 Tax=Mycolicibacterium chubuense TaxID=1800 RepID=UPI0009E2D486|nr:hypothetical protein [Mycolicibacterium chubuense]ORA54790.1 hypothetical protein BST22_05120 [Mycolicibacterium chubuense]